MEQLIAEATPAPMGALIGEAVNVIVSIAKTAEGRRVKEVLQVRGFEDGQYLFENAVTGEAESSEPAYSGLQLITDLIKEKQDAT